LFALLIDQADFRRSNFIIDSLFAKIFLLWLTATTSSDSDGLFLQSVSR